MKKNKGFTIIESMIVVVIIGFLTAIATVGFTQAERQKKLEKAAQRVGNNLDYVRNASFFGEKIGEEFPCGYGLSIGVDSQKVNTFGTVGLDKLERLNANESCDTAFEEEVTVEKKDFKTADNKSLEEVKIQSIKKAGNIDVSCIHFIFSSPRGNSYYAEDTKLGCDSNSRDLDFNIFTTDASPEYFEIIISLEKGFGDPQTKVVRIHPSGNLENVVD